MWIYVPDCRSAVDTMGLASALAWFCRAISPHCTWREKHLPSPTWKRKLKRESWLKAVFMRTPDPSTAESAVEKFISSLPAIPANPLASPGSEEAKPIRATSGRPCGELLAKYDRRSHSWKTCPATTRSASTAFKGTWPKTGMTRSGCLYRLENVGPAKNAQGSGAWPSPRPCTGKGSSGANRTEMYRAMKEVWPTPKTPTGGPEARGGKKARGSGGVDTQTAALTWATPTKDRFRTRGGTRSNEEGLDRQAKNWPTPNAGDARRGRQEPDGKRGILLSTRAKNWATPAQRDFRSGLASEKTHTKNSRPLNEQACLFSRQEEENLTAKNGRGYCESSPVLNPLFVEYLMGLPKGWTDCDCAATGSFPSWRQSHSAACFTLLLGFGPGNSNNAM